jgi:hypothetical protein
MTKQLYENNYKNMMEELLSTIEACFKAQLILPGLILLYSAIDIMAWLNRDESHADSRRSDFIHWVNNYLLPHSELTCKANDLYSARCSILHSYTSESRMSRQGEAKKIYYAWGTAHAEHLQHFINLSSEKDCTIVLHIDTLFNAFRNGVQRFNNTLSSNPLMADSFYGRAGKFFTAL